MGNITIYIKDQIRRKEKQITINKRITIGELKIKIGQPNAKFYYDGLALVDYRRIEDYGIKNGDTISFFEIRNIGGEVGSLKKGFTNPRKIGPIRYSTVPDGPDYRSTKDGLNLFGYCKNKNCIAYKKKVCSLFGFGKFDLIKDLDQDSENCPKCPACESSLLKLETCGFMNCKYKYVGIKVVNEERITVNYENSIYIPDKLDYFDAGKDWGNFDMWIELKISADP